MNGFTYCRKVRDDSNYDDVIIIVTTGLVDLDDKARIFQAGADDYLTKPIDLNEISSRMLIHVRNAVNVKKLTNFSERVTNELIVARNIIESSLPDEELIQLLYDNYNIDDVIIKLNNIGMLDSHW